MAEDDDESKVLKYECIRLEQAGNGFSLCYDCVKENPMAPKSEYGISSMSDCKKEVFEAEDSKKGWEAAFDRAASRMKELYMYNVENKKSQDDD